MTTFYISNNEFTWNSENTNSNDFYVSQQPFTWNQSTNGGQDTPDEPTPTPTPPLPTKQLSKIEIVGYYESSGESFAVSQPTIRYGDFTYTQVPLADYGTDSYCFYETENGITLAMSKNGNQGVVNVQNISTKKYRVNTLTTSNGTYKLNLTLTFTDNSVEILQTSYSSWNGLNIMTYDIPYKFNPYATKQATMLTLTCSTNTTIDGQGSPTTNLGITYQSKLTESSVPGDRSGRLYSSYVVYQRDDGIVLQYSYTDSSIQSGMQYHSTPRIYLYNSNNTAGLNNYTINGTLRFNDNSYYELNSNGRQPVFDHCYEYLIRWGTFGTFS